MIGFIGLGRMGSGMATRLLGAGHDVIVYNRSPERMGALVELGARPAGSVADASDAAAVVTMLADDNAVEEIVLGSGGVVENLARGALHVSMSTISVALARRLTEAHARAGQRFISATVFGRPDSAAQGKLFVIAAGEQSALDSAASVLDAIGQKTSIVSSTPSAANLVKLSGNFLLASVIESLGEAVALVEKGGIDPKQYLDVLTSTLFDVPAYRNYGGMIASRRFEPAGFAAPLGYKDIRLALAAADELRVPMPLANLLRERFAALLAQGGEHMDWTAIGGLASRDAGLQAR